MIRSFYTPRPVLATLLVRLFRAGRSYVPAWSRRPLVVVSLLLLPVLASAQNMGVGTTAPDAAAALDIVASDKGLLLPRVTAAARMLIGSPGTPPAGLLVYQTDGAQPGFWYYEAAAGWTHLDPKGADNLGNHAATQNLGLNGNWLSNDGSATGLRLDNAGNVGLGGAAYSGFRLSVEQPGYGTMLLRDSRPAGSQVGPHQFFVVGPAGGAEYAGAIIDYIHADAGLPHRDKALEIRAAGSANNGRINFHTGPGANLSKPQLTIRADGSVGINLAAAATPFRPLHVEGGIHAAGPIGELSFADRTVAGNRFVWYAQDDVARLFAGDLGAAGAGTDLLNVTRAGRVGIGVFGPAFQLHVQDLTGAQTVAQFDGNDASFAGIYANAAHAAGSPFYGYRHQQIIVGLHYVDPFKAWRLNLNSTERLVVTDEGLMGVNKYGPAYPLHVVAPTSSHSTVAQFEGSGLLLAGIAANATTAGAGAFYSYLLQGVTAGYHYVSAAGDWHLNLAGAERATVTTAGLLGVNTLAPAYPLHVVAPTSSYSTVAQFDGSGVGFAGVYANATAAGAVPFYGYQQQGTTKAYHQLNAFGDWQLIVNNGIRLTVDGPSGSLGVGTVNPIARLHVNGGVSTAPTGATYSYFSPGSGTLSTSTAATARNIAAYFEGGQVWVNSAIVAGALNTSSDRRIKQVVGRSDGAHDLALLNELHITDYRYIDQLNNPATVVKKVIAQEVETVLPAAVSRSRMAIPDVYEVAEAVRWAPATGTVTVRTTKAHGFRAGDQVRLYTPQQQDHNPYVFVLDEHTFSYIAPEAPADRLFVYGKFVDDFRSVDYDALAMLNVSATQELARQVAALQQQNTALQQQVEASTQGVEQRLRELETRLGAARK